MYGFLKTPQLILIPIFPPISSQYKQLLISTRVVYSLIIINKAGGLVFQRDFNTALNKLSINDYLVLAGTFHGYLPYVPFIA